MKEGRKEGGRERGAGGLGRVVMGNGWIIDRMDGYAWACGARMDFFSFRAEEGGGGGRVIPGSKQGRKSRKVPGFLFQHVNTACMCVAPPSSVLVCPTRNHNATLPLPLRTQY